MYDLRQLFTKRKVDFQHPDRRRKPVERSALAPRVAYSTQTLFSTYVPHPARSVALHWFNFPATQMIYFRPGVPLVISASVLDYQPQGHWTGRRSRHSRIVYTPANRPYRETHEEFILAFETEEDVLFLALSGLLDADNVDRRYLIRPK